VSKLFSFNEMATTITSENLDRNFLTTSDALVSTIGQNGFHEEKNIGKANTNCTENEPVSHYNNYLTVDYVNQVASTISSESNPPSSHGTNIIVVLPSIDFDEVELQRINRVVGFYEERQLYHLFLLQDPSYRVIYLSSHPIREDIVRYFVSLNCTYEFQVDERLSRLSLLTIGSRDASYKSLSVKVFQNHELVDLIAREISQFSYPSKAVCKTGLSVFTGSQSADQLAHLLGIRLLEAGSDSIYYGTKQGSREIFQACGIPLPPGTPDVQLGDDDLLTIGTSGDGCMTHLRFIRTPQALAKGIARQILLRNVKPRLWVIKLNQGFSGKGNAFLDLSEVQNKQYDGVKMDDCVELMSREILERLPQLQFVCRSMTWYD